MKKGLAFSCEICHTSFNTTEQLRTHLESHDDSDIGEAINSPKEIAKTIIEQELQERKILKSPHNWLQTIPAVLWAMRTAALSTRRASPYKLIFGKQPNSTSDLLFGQRINKSDSTTRIQDYLMQKLGKINWLGHSHRPICKNKLKGSVNIT